MSSASGEWDVTAIEIALDLATPRTSDSSTLAFNGPAEPRICLVAAFALTSHLKRIVAAVDRAMPARAPSGLRIVHPMARRADGAAPTTVSIQPTPALLRLQSRLVRAIEPGLAHSEDSVAVRGTGDMDEAAVRFIREFIPCRSLPALEPPFGPADDAQFRAVGITIYCLGRRGTPESILAHWAYT
jgi:hypothetical protein